MFQRQGLPTGRLAKVLLRKGEPASPNRQGVSFAREIPIRGPDTMVTGCGDGSMRHDRESRDRPLSLPVIPNA